MKFSVKNLFSKCEKIRRFLRISSHLLKRSLTENLTLGVVNRPYITVPTKLF